MGRENVQEKLPDLNFRSHFPEISLQGAVDTLKVCTEMASVEWSHKKDGGNAFGTN